MNGSETTDIVDALITAQYYVGLNPQGFNPDAADAIVNFAMSNSMKVRGYCLVWHNQTPG
ncbi:MAG: endo-1,4-beta-xylanase [Spirochaetales bacterium]|nr:endo-1,4-beta-xylanase [Spirochaetales bacterium]